MALTTYAELQTAIGDFMNRTDLTSAIPDFITLSEKRIRRELRTMFEEARATASTVAGEEALALPTDFNGTRSIFIQGNPKIALTEVSLDKLRKAHASSYSGKPQMYAISDEQLIFGPTPDAVYTVQMAYYAFAALSVSNTSNTVLARHPDVYLNLGCYEAARYIKDMEAMAYWGAEADRVINDIKNDDKYVRYGMSPLRAIPQSAP